MTLAPDSLKLEYLGVAIFMFGGAWALIRWVGRTIRDQLGPGMNRDDEPFLPPQADMLPPALVKRAIERGLVTSAQLAGMTPMERQFLLASLKDKLEDAAPTPAGPAASAAPVPPSATADAAAAGAAVTPRAIDGAAFGMAAIPVNDRYRLFCPLCGGAIAFPAFAPLVALCQQCGTKTTLREEVPGRYVLQVAPGAAVKD